MPMDKITLGSLFDDISGFGCVASWYGIEPVWASEIEAAPMRIASRHFPNMQQLGDITKIRGDKIQPVDIISGGFPCVDISIAGKVAGISVQCDECGHTINFANYDNSGVCPECGAELSLTRSGLFTEAIRIIKEMREKTNEQYPKIVVIENVANLISSNNGDDFYTVIKALCELIGERLPVLRPARWSNAGEILADNGSIAWRILDAQYWGVPQRRRRIFLVCDLRGQSAGEVLFKSQSLRWHSPTCETPWEKFTSKARKGIDSADATEKKSAYRIGSYESNAMKSPNPESGIYQTDISATLDTSGGNPACNQGGIAIVDDSVTADGFCATASASMDIQYTENGSPTIKACGRNGVLIASVKNTDIAIADDSVYALQGNGIDRKDENGCAGKGWSQGACYTLNTVDRHAVSYESVESAGFLPNNGAKTRDIGFEEEKSPTLKTDGAVGCLIEKTLIDTNPTDARYTIADGVCQTLRSRMGTGGNNEPLVLEERVEQTLYDAYQHNGYRESDVCSHLTACNMSKSLNGGTPLVVQKSDPISIGNEQMCQLTEKNPDVARTLDCQDGPQLIVTDVAAVDCQNSTENGDVNGTLQAHGSGGWSVNTNNVVRVHSVVRRLTPLEAERLQGFEDGWTSGESDSARYKALGNSVALPCVNYIFAGIMDVLDPEENVN